MNIQTYTLLLGLISLLALLIEEKPVYVRVARETQFPG